MVWCLWWDTKGTVQARAVEALVRANMQHTEFIILCLEDSSDWSIATTPRTVRKLDTLVAEELQGAGAACETRQL
ncbi:unnamed protein product [Arabis nemorensis]|uniref:Uncharacterized protein n=1 Tax=Arabis nemorensis TaxID=586526 RepID=A0A565BB99_9BRAS|nr:unnamed protein product [Arabis nemorensis]